MAQIPDAKQLDALVTRIVDQAGARLTETASDAQKRARSLETAKKASGNRLHANDVKASLAGEGTLVLDARALAKQLTALRADMVADLQKLVTAGRETTDI